MGDDYLAQAISTEGVEITPALIALRLYIEEHAEQLFGIIQTYVVKARIGTSDEVEVIAHEVMQGTILEALRHVDKFDPSRPPQAWLLGISLNLIKRYRDQLAKQNHRQPTISQLNITPDASDVLALFDTLATLNSWAFDALAQDSPETILENKETEAALLNRLHWAWSQLSDKEREIIQLKMQKGYSAEQIGQALRKTSGAARVSLHRAITKLSRIMSGNGGPQS